jgi:large subunit ribosomal protein L10
MPSSKILEGKKKIVDTLAEEISSAQTFLVADYRGLTVEEDTAMRAELRNENVKYKVVKNSLITFAAQKVGKEFLAPLFEGPTAIAYSTEDVVTPAKVLQKFADKIEAFSIKGGFMEDKEIDLKEIKALASIPPKEELYARVVCGIAAPITGLAMTLGALSKKAEEEGKENLSELAVSA